MDPEVSAPVHEFYDVAETAGVGRLADLLLRVHHWACALHEVISHTSLCDIVTFRQLFKR